MRFPSRVYVLLGLALASAPFFIAAGAPGCGVSLLDCAVWDENRLGVDGQPDPCCQRQPTSFCPPPGAGQDAGSDADGAASDADGGPPSGDAGGDADAADAADATADADGGPSCPGACLELPPAGWLGPGFLLWRGDVGATIDCPLVAPVTAYTGFADLDAGPASCGACWCGPSPENSCGPPQHLIASTATCLGGDAGVPSPFDSPPGWDGSCTNFEGIAAGAKSLTSGPLTLTETCIADAGAADALTPPPGFGSAIVVCVGTTSSCDFGHACTPVAPGFQSCIFQQGDWACPASYPDRIAVAQGFNDQRGCAPCGCAIAGGSCSATLTVYSDPACATPLLFARTLDNMTVTAPCDDAPGTLGSKTLSSAKYAPGACSPSGGEPTDGGVTPTGVATFCCLGL